jgi:protein-S-isoprenylcysteine O-methyltransferase Ste14
VLLGAAMFYGSIGLVLYTIVFWSAAHLFVLFYEEPVLRRTFGTDYDEYTATRRRWMPRWRS